MADAQSNIKVSIDTTEALASIKNLQRQISAFHTSMAKSGAAANAVTSQMQQGLINSINATGKFSAQMKTIKTTTESFTNSLEKNKFSMGEYFRYAGGASKTFGKLFKSEFETINKVARENVKDLQTQYIKMGRDANGAMKAIAVRPLALDMNDLATKTMIASEKQALLNQLLKQGSTNLLNFGKNTQWAGRQLMVGFTIPLIAVGSAAAKTFMEMETQAIRFKKVYGDLFTSTSESSAALEEIKTLGKEFTKYGIAVKDTVGLAAEAAAAGFKGVDLQRQTAAATKLSILGQVESQKALETTIALQNAFSMSSQDLATNIDFLNAVENQTVLSLDDMSTAIPKAAPVVQQLGGDVKDLAFFMTAMKEGGINASEGANALKSGLASMINPTGKASAMLEGFGINIKKIVVDNKGNLKKTVIDFATALNQLDPLNRAQAIEQMFGKFQFARLSTLFANVTKEGTQAARVLDLAGSSVQELASLSEKELGMTSESAMNKFKGAVENLKLSLVPVGEEFLKAVTPIAEFVTKILDKFNNLGDGTKKIIVTMTAIVAGLGPVLLMTFGLLANGLANIIKGFTFMKTIFNKTGQSTATLGTEVKYMTLEQRNAAAVAASLDQVHRNLAQTFTAEATSVDRLTAAYSRSIAAQSQFMPTKVPLGRGPIKKRASGKPAVVGGTGNQDSELSWLMPGETVIPTKMSKKYGSLINGMIADNIPGYGKGKSSSGNRSMYGGQERILAPYTMMAPGNKPGGFGMDEAFLASDDFARSLTNTAVAAGSIEGKIRLTDKSMDELANLATPYTKEITDELRLASQEMAKTGKSATHISQLFDTKKKEIDSILSRMAASGSQGSAMARGLQVTAYPTDTDIRTGGNVRVPGVDVDPQGNVVRAAPRSVRSGRASQFQTKIGRITSRRPLDTQERITRAHVVPEARVLAGGVMPLGGGALGLPEEQQRAARLELEKRNIKLSQQLGIKNAQAYDSGVKSVKVKDPYEQSRNRKSPHRLAAKDGADDGKSYSTAVQKSIDRHNRKLSKQGQLGIANQTLATPNKREKLASKAKGLGGKMNSFGGGMGLLGANIGLSMMPDFAGKSVAQGTLTGASLGQMFGPYGMAAGAAIGLVTSAYTTLIAKQKEHAAITKSVFTSSVADIEYFGSKVIDTTLKINNLGSGIKGITTLFGNVTPEVQKFVDYISQLPEDDPTKMFVEGLKKLDTVSQTTGNIRSRVSEAISVGGMDPKDAQKYVASLLAAAGKAGQFAQVWKNVQASLVDETTATVTMFDKLGKAVKATNADWYALGAGNKWVARTYKGLNTEQQLVADKLLDLTGALTNGSMTASQFTTRLNGIKNSAFNGVIGLNALRAAVVNTGDKEALSGFDAIGFQLDQIGAKSVDAMIKLLALRNLNLTPEGAAKILGKKYNSSLPSHIKEKTDAQLLLDASGTKQVAKMMDAAAADRQKLNEALYGTKDYMDPNTDSKGAGKTPAEKYLEILQKQIDALEEKKNAQKELNDQIQKEIDMQEKMQDLESQAVNAKISGNYIQAASLGQQSQNLQAQYARDLALEKMNDPIDALRARKKAIEDGAKLTKSELSQIPKKASGGSIRGAGTGTSDSIPALLSNGEYVIKTASVNKYGVDVFDALNAGKFAMGGLFSGTPNPKPNTGGSIGVIGGNAKPAQQRKTVLETPYDSAKRLYQESNKKVVKIPVPPIRANFATNSYDLNKEQREELKAIAQQLIKSKLKSMVVQGHADSRGGVDNDLLSLNRAKATAAYLAKLVPGTSFIPVGHGVYKPLVPNTSAENMALNRRAELFLPDKYKTIYPDFNPTKHKSMLIGMGSIPATNGVLGRAIGGLIQKFANGGTSNLNYNMPSYKSGIDYIPHDQIAQLHKGERVITAQDNKNFSSGTSVMNVEMNITGSNSDDIAKKVMVELDRLQQKNNKTNKVRI
jgi:TP901 family phage tail tape measure protein